MAKSAEKDIIAVLKQRVEKFEDKVSIVDVGIVAEVGDGIARIHGLGSVGSNELLRFPGDVMGIAMNLEEGYVSAIILGEDAGIKEGDEVKATGRVAEVPVGSAMIGRVIDALGRPIDGKGDIKTGSSRPVERIAPNVVARKSVDTPVQTGIKSIDSMFPIGRGQRQL
ncbi:MAG: F0F1 ATP synthase subunit alpha, partial [Dehalococcoidales bacterium]